MAEKIFGTAHLFGVSGTYANGVVESFSESGSHQLVATTEDEVGRQVEERLDDEVYEATMSVRIRQGAAIPVLGDTITFDGETFWITGVDKSESNKDFRRFSIKVKRTEYITAV